MNAKSTCLGKGSLTSILLEANDCAAWMVEMSKIKVTVERIDGHCNLPVLVGDHFFVDGSRLSVPKDSNVCIWALQSMMPVFPIYNVKENLPDDHWVKSVKHFTCPDPEGRVIFRLEALEE